MVVFSCATVLPALPFRIVTVIAKADSIEFVVFIDAKFAERKSCRISVVFLDLSPTFRFFSDSAIGISLKILVIKYQGFYLSASRFSANKPLLQRKA
ncbi:MAG: hypothetical protein ACEY3J_04265 [Arsenophonus sp.]